jgi:hypothetical protein
MQRDHRSRTSLFALLAAATVATLGVGCTASPATTPASSHHDGRQQLRSHVSLDDGSWAHSRQARLGVTATGSAAMMGASSGPVAGGYATYARLHDIAPPTATPTATPAAFAEVPTP